MFRIKKIAYIVIFAFLIYSDCSASKFAFGAGISYGRIFNQSKFNALPDIPRPDISLTESNPSWGFDYSLITSLHLAELFKIGVRFDFNKLTFNYRDLESTVISRGGVPESAIIENTLQTDFISAGAEPTIGIIISKAFSLNLGMKFGYVFNTSFNQRMQFIKPADVGFIDPIGNYSGKIPQATTLNYIPTVRIESETNLLQISKIKVKPEVTGQILINDLVGGLNWKYYKLSAGVTFSFEPEAKTEILRDTIIQRDTAEVITTSAKEKKIVLKARMAAIQKESNAEHVIISEQYEIHQPKQKSLLMGEMNTVFLFANNNEQKEFSLEYKKTINEYVNFSYSPVSKSNIKFLNKANYITDTTSSLDFPKVIFYPKVIAESGLMKWTIELTIDGKQFKKIDGELDIKSKVEWNPLDDFSSDDINGKTVHYMLKLEDFDSTLSDAATGEIIFRGSEQKQKETYITRKIITAQDDVQKFQSLEYIFDNLNKEKIFVYHIQNRPGNPSDELQKELSKFGMIRNGLPSEFQSIRDSFPSYNYYLIIIE